MNSKEPDDLDRMELAVEDSFVQAAQPFVDGFGERPVVLDAHGEHLDVLRLNAALSGTPAFEAALRERTGRIAGFRHDSFARCGLSKSIVPLARSSLFQTTFAVRDWRRSWRARKALPCPSILRRPRASFANSFTPRLRGETRCPTPFMAPSAQIA